MRFRVLALCVLLVVVPCVGAMPVAGQPDEEVRLEAQIQEDGDARWTIVATIPIADEEDEAVFREFAAEYESGGQAYDLGIETFEAAAREASAAAGREMRIVAVERETRVVNETDDEETERRWGELRLSFTWTAFARQEDGDLVVDDAFNTTDGTWLSAIDEGQTLVIKSPPGYSVRTAPVAIQEGELRWEGPAEFESGYIEIVFEPGPRQWLDSILSTVLFAGAILIGGVVILFGGYFFVRRRGTPGRRLPFPLSNSNTAPTGAAATDTGADGEAASSEQDVGVELLSDEERVERLLEQHGGRMKQANIVEETDWSNAKVSQLLSSMAEDDRIKKLRIGRENLIALPNEDIGEFKE